MYNQSRQSGLIRFARVDAGSTVIDVYPGDGDWTRIFSDAAGPEGRIYSFVPAEVAHFNNDPVGRMRTLAQEPGRENRSDEHTSELQSLLRNSSDVLCLK